MEEVQDQSGWTTSSALAVRCRWLTADIVAGIFTTAVTMKTSQSSVTLVIVSTDKRKRSYCPLNYSLYAINSDLYCAQFYGHFFYISPCFRRDTSNWEISSSL